MGKKLTERQMIALDDSMNNENNLSIDGTRYEFVKQTEPWLTGEKTVWYVRAHYRAQGSYTTQCFDFPYNKGRFNHTDYFESQSKANAGVAFWDWLKGVTTKERRSFRDHWMWHMEEKEPLTIQQYREAIKARDLNCGFKIIDDTVAHTEPTKVGLTQDIWDLYCSPPLVVNSQQEGINPMRSIYDTPAMPKSTTTTATTINLMPAANASVSAQTDTQQQREYLMQRFETAAGDRSWHSNSAKSKFSHKARDLYNLDADNSPKSLDDLIARLAAKDYTLDETKVALQKKYDGGYTEDDDIYVPPLSNYFWALTWNGPAPDRKGYEAQLDAFTAKARDTKDTIMIGEPKDGLAALQALEAFEPTGPAN